MPLMIRQGNPAHTFNNVPLAYEGLTRKLVVNKTIQAELIVHAMP